MLPDVIDVRYTGGYRLWVAFEDGVAGEIDLQPHLEFAGVFEPLADLRYFSKVRVDSDAGQSSGPTTRISTRSFFTRGSRTGQ